MERRERMNRDSGMKDRDERSRGMEIHITETLDKIKSTEPLRLEKKIQSEEIETDPTPPAVH